MSKLVNKSNIPVFTQEHLDYLNQVFPEQVSITDSAGLYTRLGTRQVVKHIERLVEQTLVLKRKV